MVNDFLVVSFDRFEHNMSFHREKLSKVKTQTRENLRRRNLFFDSLKIMANKRPEFKCLPLYIAPFVLPLVLSFFVFSIAFGSLHCPLLPSSFLRFPLLSFASPFFPLSLTFSTSIFRLGLILHCCPLYSRWACFEYKISWPEIIKHERNTRLGCSKGRRNWNPCQFTGEIAKTWTIFLCVPQGPVSFLSVVRVVLVQRKLYLWVN